jgi:3-hydroxybutyryl-CoA dehydrogenase
MESKSIAIIGAGTMGHGIAQVFALAGHRVTLNDNNRENLDSAHSRIKRNLQLCVEHGIVDLEQAESVPSRISLEPDLAQAVGPADFIVEAVLEDLALKQSLLPEVESYCQPDTIITSNSSSFRVGDMAEALQRPRQFLGTHYWNPPHLIPLVEVIIGEQTSTEVVETTVNLLKDVGKNPAMVRKDVPGFVGNRLQHALRREAIAIVDAGIASPEDVDMIVRLGFGLRLPITGPMETADLGGLDLTLSIQNYLLPYLDRSTEPKPILRRKVNEGELGAKAGQGFFEWPADRHAEVIERRDQGILELVKWLRSGGYLDV